ncbi:RNA-binding protein [Elizabethkingia sp. HX WHF]|jgi:RNA recognition motif-containing protein|uniref:RNA-binding protein n=2 Tax=Elizabethkingia TaxID=308865 RepID=A0A7T7ZYJ6_9FLAO|nr:MULTISPECIES: RNA-binding protein [Elizabethkingia]AJW62398.1 RNA recognition motif protein [Elizabethkingia miricola]AQX10297.1 RNA-binding protein [Elizabethkingia ursingii]AQX85168.1 RNA-binding protein [Elizabethkingia bruuniana]ATL42411.1 RNA-binding protein [Elizabethkingia miricola]KGO09499.1 RNA-binding protein [Elizabethkingia miricola]
MNILVGKLNPQTTEQQLEKHFNSFGFITAVDIIKESYSGDSLGYGYVLMPNPEEAETAIKKLNGTSLDGHSIFVSKASQNSSRYRL